MHPYETRRHCRCAPSVIGKFICSLIPEGRVQSVCYETEEAWSYEEAVELFCKSKNVYSKGTVVVGRDIAGAIAPLSIQLFKVEPQSGYKIERVG